MLAGRESKRESSLENTAAAALQTKNLHEQGHCREGRLIPAYDTPVGFLSRLAADEGKELQRSQVTGSS
jgi:hypothetical protein